MGLCGSKDTDSIAVVVSRQAAQRREFTGKPVVLVRHSDKVMRENAVREELERHNKHEFDEQERDLDQELTAIAESIARLAADAASAEGGATVVQKARMKALLQRKASIERMLATMIEQRAGIDSLADEMKMANINKKLMAQTDALAKSGAKIVYDVKKVETLSDNVDTAASNASDYNAEVKSATTGAVPADVMIQVDDSAVSQAFAVKQQQQQRVAPLVAAASAATAARKPAAAAQAAHALQYGVPLPQATGSSKTNNGQAQHSRYTQLDEDQEETAVVPAAEEDAELVV